MTVITPQSTAARAAAPGPHLMADPAADRIVGVLFVLSIAVFLLALAAL